MTKHNLADFAIGWCVVIACIPLLVIAVLYGQSIRSAAPAAPVGGTRVQEVKEAAPFTIGEFRVANGWRFTPGRDGGIQAAGVAVRNTDAKTRRAFFTFILLNHDARVDSIYCSTQAIRPSEVGAADCADVSGGDHPRDFDRIGVEPTF